MAASSPPSDAKLQLLGLPEEVLVRILSFLDPRDIILGVRRTSFYLCELSFSPELWRRVNIYCQFSREVCRRVKTVIHQFYRNLLEQKCVERGRQGTGIGSTQSRQTGEKGQGLTVKDAVKCLLQKGPVDRALSVTGEMYYPNLREVRLEEVICKNVGFLARYPALVHVNITLQEERDRNWRRPGEDRPPEPPSYTADMFHILKGLTNLRTLIFNLVSTGGKDRPIREAMMRYFATGPGLKHVAVCGDVVEDGVLEAILDHCSQLETLGLRTSMLTAQAFTAAANKPKPKLSSLHLELCGNLDDSSLEDMSEAFPHLRRLQLDLTKEMTDAGLGLLLRACSQLTGVVLTAPCNSQKLVGSSLEVLVNRGNLRTLHLSNFALPKSLFKRLCQHHATLRSVVLKHCRVDNSDVMAMARCCPRLESVMVRQCPGVDASTLASMMNKLPCLLSCHLDMKRLSRKRTRSGRHVSLDRPNKNGQLRELSVEMHTELMYVPTSALPHVHTAALLSPYPGLRCMSLRTLRCLSDLELREILRTCPQLEELKVFAKPPECSKNTLTSSALGYIRKWGSHLRSLMLLTRRYFQDADLAKMIATGTPRLGLCVVPMERKFFKESLVRCEERLGQVVGDLVTQNLPQGRGGQVVVEILNERYGDPDSRVSNTWFFMRIHVRYRLDREWENVGVAPPRESSLFPFADHS